VSPVSQPASLPQQLASLSQQLVSAVRALDRVLMSGCYAIPLFNVQEQWIARWNRIESPKAAALSGYLPETWWRRPAPQTK